MHPRNLKLQVKYVGMQQITAVWLKVHISLRDSPCDPWPLAPKT